VDPRKELSAILRGGGGLGLCYRLMKTSLHEHVIIMANVEKACWDYYTEEITTVKSPADNLRRLWSLCFNQWASKHHLLATLRNSLLEKLDDMHIPMGESSYATKVLHFSWSLAAHLAWTMSKHSAPFDCYAAILQPGDQHGPTRQRGATLLKTHHENVLSLERAVPTIRAAKQVWEACLFLRMQPVRLVMELFRRDKYADQSPDGRHLLTGALANLPDNKIVEDIHGSLRIASKGNSNDKLSNVTIQEIINHTHVIEARNIRHAPAITEAR